MLDPNKILELEFNYAKDTAFQANEDRVKEYSYFLTTAATIAGGFAFIDLESDLQIIVFSLLLLSIWFLGLLSSLKLIKLRMGWLSSVKAMLKIKQFYTAQDKSLTKAFKWNESSLPSVNKYWSITFINFLTITVVSILSLITAISIFLVNIADLGIWESVIIAVASGILMLLVNIAIWFGSKNA